MQDKKIISENIFGVLLNYFRQSKKEIYVVSPFINDTVLEKLLFECGSRHVTIITSWKKEHLLTGVSSIKLFEKCRANEWSLFINDNLHAKIYSVDLESAFLGSANCTEKGLMDGKISNLECMTLLDPLNFDDRVVIEKIKLSSTYVSDTIYKKYAEWMENKQVVEKIKIESGELYIETELFTSMLPATKSPEELWDIISNTSGYDNDSLRRAEHDMALFSRTRVSSMGELLIDAKQMAMKNRFIDRYLNSFDKETYFGETTAWVHNNCCDDPAPYRKEVKQLVSNLFNWLPKIFDEFEVTVPGYKSQLLKRI